MDNDPKPDIKVSQTISDVLQSESFKHRLIKMNKELAKVQYNTGSLGRLSGNYEMKLNNVFDDLRLRAESQTVISGLIYGSDENDELTGERVYETDVELTYVGISVRRIDGRPRIMMTFAWDTGESDEDGPIEEYVYIDPFNITRFEVFEKSEEDKTIEDILFDLSDESQALTSDEQFLRLPLARQKEALDAFTDHVHAKVSEYFEDDTWAVESFIFMSEYSDLPVALSDTLVDQSDTSSDELYTPIGTYEGCTFAELRASHLPALDQITQQNQLSLGNGVPCLIFENKSDTGITKYIIPIDKIIDSHAMR